MLLCLKSTLSCHYKHSYMLNQKHASCMPRASRREKGFHTQKMACACVPESLRVVPNPVQGCAKNVSLPVCSSDLSLFVSSARGRQVRGSRQGVKLFYISATLGRQDKDSGKTSEGPAACAMIAFLTLQCRVPRIPITRAEPSKMLRISARTTESTS